MPPPSPGQTTSKTLQGELLVNRDGPIAVVTLNRPQRLNALSNGVVDQLHSLLTQLDNEQQVRAIVLTGAGRAFCAGVDLQADAAEPENVLRDHYNPLIAAMLSLSTPLVAAVNGVAAGVGVSIALACDLRVAAISASFVLSFVNVGLVPDGGATWLLSRAVGKTWAAELALLGERVAADRALTMGLVNRVVSDVEQLQLACELAQTLARSSLSVGATRRLLNRGMDATIADQLEAEAIEQNQALRRPDFDEARRAFAEKRPPKFS